MRVASLRNHVDEGMIVELDRAQYKLDLNKSIEEGTNVFNFYTGMEMMIDLDNTNANISSKDIVKSVVQLKQKTVNIKNLRLEQHLLSPQPGIDKPEYPI